MGWMLSQEALPKSRRLRGGEAALGVTDFRGFGGLGGFRIYGFRGFGVLEFRV